MKRIANLARWLIAALAVLGVLAYGAAAAVTVADIIGRRFGLPVAGVVDLVQLFVVGGAWLVMPYAFLAGAHVGVDFIVSRMPRALAMSLRTLSALLAMALVGVMLWQGYLTFETRTMFGDKSQQLGIPIAWYWYPLLAGMLISLVAIPLERTALASSEPRHE